MQTTEVEIQLSLRRLPDSMRYFRSSLAPGRASGQNSLHRGYTLRCLAVHPLVFDYHEVDLNFVSLHRRFVFCLVNNPTLEYIES